MIIRNMRSELFRDAQRHYAIDATGQILPSAINEINNIIQPNKTSFKPGDVFVWDFTPIVRDGVLIGFLYLNAPFETVENEQHHFHAQIGLAKTKDMREIEWVKHDVFKADKTLWDNGSIWSSDVIWHQNQWMLFYTSRDLNRDDGMTQSIGLATSPDLMNWSRVDDFKLDADPEWYETKSNPKDLTIHAWRDPYLFFYDESLYMLLSAKDKTKPIGENGCVAILKSLDDSLQSWEAMPPLASPDSFSEMEEPEILLSEMNEWVLTFSSWKKYDKALGKGGLLAISLGDDVFDGIHEKVESLVPESSGIYAAHAIPEVEGAEIMGFDIKDGGIKRSGVFTNLSRP